MGIPSVVFGPTGRPKNVIFNSNAYQKNNQDPLISFCHDMVIYDYSISKLITSILRATSQRNCSYKLH